MSTKRVIDILRSITVNDKDIVSAGFVGSLSVEGKKAEVVLIFPEGFESRAEDVKRIVERKLNDEGFDVDVRYNVRKSKPKLTVDPVLQTQKSVPGVKKVIAVASGKGGVGKSTVAVNLAVALSKIGLRSGLFDADVYGPSVSILMGVEDERVYVTPDKKFKPIEKYGVEVISFGSMVRGDTPILWRGAMLHKAYNDLLLGTAWGDLDVLVIDLPPGTGDTHLSLSQGYKIDGVLIVTTPQVVAMADVLRAIKGFEKLEVPVLGIVENMSYFICPESGKSYRIFGEGNTKRLSKLTGLPILATIPIDENVSLSGDNGMPVVYAYPDSPTSKIFHELAETVKRNVFSDSKV